MRIKDLFSNGADSEHDPLANFRERMARGAAADHVAMQQQVDFANGVTSIQGVHEMGGSLLDNAKAWMNRALNRNPSHNHHRHS